MITVILSVIAPLLFFFIPGCIFIRSRQSIIHASALIFLTSLVFFTLTSFVLTYFHLSLWWCWGLAFLITFYGFWHHRHELIAARHHFLLILSVFLLLFGIFSLPLLLLRDGLPTGDSQKAIYWAEHIYTNHHLPDYSQSIELFNRDPVDFYTPGLHTLVAALLPITSLALISVSFLSIALSIATAFVLAATARLIFPHIARLPLIFLTIFLILTNLRFSRYLIDPGYHLQNIAGEFFLFGAIYLCLLLVRHHLTWPRVTLLAALLVALFITHQFSAFIAAFVLLPFAVPLTLKAFASARNRYRFLPFILGILIATLILIAFQLGLHQKIGDFFTTTPHLLADTPNLSDYPRLLGITWTFLSLTGIGLFIISLRSSSQRSLHLTYLISLLVLLALSQAPHFGLDIPPVRALFYVIAPLSIFAAFAWIEIYKLMLTWRSNRWRYILPTLSSIILITIITIPAIASYQPNFSVRTNSTLQPEIIAALSELNLLSDKSGLVADDYNQRSTSWFLLSSHPVFSRSADDLSRIMAESNQSELRHTIYLNQLDYEKIFDLGNSDCLPALLNAHDINWIVADNDTSTSSFTRNQNLQTVFTGSTFTIFHYNEQDINDSSPLCSWLLKSSTLANDLGDDEDIYLHLPASLRTTRLDDNGNTTAPIIPLYFNVGTYNQALIDQDKNQYPDSSLQLYLSFNTSPHTNLTVQTPSGTILPITSDSALKIEPQQLKIDNEGFIVLNLLNPQQSLVNLDLIALGLANTP